jgi:predicted nucleic acid-binding protein
MKYLIDSDWIADWLKGRSNAIQLLDDLTPDGIAIRIVTYGEVYEGIYFGRDSERYERVFRAFLRGVRVLPISRSVARRFALVRGTLRTQGQIIPQPDILIAATALVHDLTLVTRNVRDFQRIPGLSLHPIPTR